MSELESSRNLGACCGCRREDGTVRTIMCLPVKGPAPGKGWGCVVCSLPTDGAVAVLCDECARLKIEPIEACAGYPLEPGRVVIAELTEPYEHDEAVDHA